MSSDNYSLFGEPSTANTLAPSEADTVSLFEPTSTLNTRSLFDPVKSLEERKAEKLAHLGQKSQYSNLSDSYTELENGIIESNANKIWNNLSGAEFSSIWDYASNNLALGQDDNGYYNISTGERYEGPVRRAYGYGTQADDTTYKFGLARGDRPSSDSRYTDYAVGPEGVDISKKQHDILLPDYIAQTVEALGHGREEALAGRVVPDRLDLENYDRFGGGATEYYKSKEAFFGDPTAENYGTAFTPEQAKDVLYQYATQDYAKSPYYKGKYSDKDYLDTYYKRLAEGAMQSKYDSQSAVDEALQTVSALPAGVAKGFLDLVDAGQEVLTYLPQLAARVATGDNTLDIDLFDDGYKQAAISFIDDAVGYDRRLDEVTLQRATQEFQEAGIDITSWDSIKSAITDPEKRAKIGSAAWMVLTDPSLTAGMVTEIVGSGIGLGAATKAGTKLVSKFAPAAEKAITSALQSNLSKIKVDVAKAAAAGDTAKIAQLQQSYTLAKQVPDLLRGSIYTNADMMVRMNNDITAFKENNDGEGPDAAKLFQIAALNRIASSAEVMSLKSLAGIKNIPPALAKEAVKKGIIRSAGETVGRVALGGAQEGTQEFFDTVIEQLNQKVGAADFENKSISEILSEASAEILTGTVAGFAGGVQIKTGSVALDGLRAIGGKAGQAVLDKKKATPAAEEPAVDPELSDEAVATVTTEADKTASNTAFKYASMFGETEGMAIFQSEDQADQDVIDTPTFDAAIEASDMTYADMIAEIESAEVVIEDRQSTDRKLEGDDLALRMLRKAKARASQKIMEAEEPPTLGSGFSPEDVVDTFIESKVSVDGTLDITEDEKALVNDYLKKNGQKPYRFANIAAKLEGKDAAAVYEDSQGTGANSAPNRRARLKRLVNTPGVNKSLVEKELAGIKNFLNTQLDRKKEYEVERKAVQADIDRYNNATNEAARAVPPKSRDFGDGKFINVKKGPDGKYAIAESSQAVLDSIDDTIDHLQTTLTRYNKATVRVLGETSATTDSFVDVPVSTQINKDAQASREKHKKYYDDRKPTKVITDKDSSPKWWVEGGDYANLNESKLTNTKSSFTADDVVLLTTLDIKKGSTASQILRKAIDAGATIILDEPLKKKADSKEVRSLARRYGAGVVTVDGIVKWRPAKEADKIQAEGQEAAKAKTRKDAIIQRMVDAFDEVFTASAEKRPVSKEAKAKLNKAMDTAKEFFASDKLTDKEIKENMRKHAKTAIAKDAATLAKELREIMLTEGTSSKAYSERVGKATKGAARIADKQVKAEEARLSKGGILVTEWRDAEIEAKKGGKSLTEWIKETFGKDARTIAVNMIKNSIGKVKNPEKTIYAYKRKGKSEYTTTTRLEDVKNFSEDGVYQVIQVDPETYVQVSEATVLNTLNVEELKLEGEANALFNDFVEKAVTNLTATLKQLELDRKVLPFDLIDSPAASLIYDADSNLNANFAVAARIALYNFVRNNGYLMSKEFKTEKDIAEMLGKHESELSDTAILAMQDKGLIFKTATDSIGKDIAKLLGLKGKSSDDVDAQLFTALTTELGQIALAMGMHKSEGMLKMDRMSSVEFATQVLGKKSVDKSNSESVINFIGIKDQDKVDLAAFVLADLDRVMPNLDVRRKEPSFKPLTEEEKSKASGKIRKERLGVNVATESKEAMEELMDTEMVADMPLLRFAIKKENKERIMKLLGWVELDSDEFKALSYKEQQTQASKNRDIERNFQHLEWLNDSVDAKENKVSMWFKYFFSKNGRFFVDSNTVNPQTNKHLDRFFVQPKAHTNTYKRVGNKFYVGDKDVTALVHYALAQGFGFATDKKSASQIKAFSENILNNLKTKAALNKARETFLDKGEVEGLGIEIEHLGHALQAFAFVEDSLTGTVTSALTAEFDAVTSGFALKLLQMPIIGKKLYDWLGKVGILKKDSEYIDQLGDEGLSMNNLLDLKTITKGGTNFLDSYQFLASSVEGVTYKTLQENSKGAPLLKANEGYAKDLWDAVAKVLPSVDPEGGISSDLRNLFKYPFMTFNYASSIKSIRGRLKVTMQDDIAKKIAKIDLDNVKDKEQSLVEMLKAFAESDDIKVLKELQKQVREKDMKFVKVGKGASLGQYLDVMIDASYGVQVETVLNNEFAPFVEAQDAINGSFKAMFEVFKVAFEQELLEARKQGPVSAAKEKAIYESLKNKWPAIKGPLSNMEEEFSADGTIGVYSTETASPYGVYAGRKAAITKLSDDLKSEVGAATIRTSHMIKTLGAAISAGSVIPIHYIDGAVMGTAILAMKGGMTSIHDAIMPNLLRMGEAQNAYNKATVEVSAGYSFIDEIVKSLDRIIEGTELFSQDGKTPYQKAEVQVDYETTSNAASYIIETRNTMAAIANKVNAARKELFDSLNEGAHVMHMAGSADGVHNIGEGSKIEYTEIDRYEQIKDNSTNVTINNVDDTELHNLAKNLC